MMWTFIPKSQFVSSVCTTSTAQRMSASRIPLLPSADSVMAHRSASYMWLCMCYCAIWCVAFTPACAHEVPHPLLGSMHRDEDFIEPIFVLLYCSEGKEHNPFKGLQGLSLFYMYVSCIKLCI